MGFWIGLGVAVLALLMLVLEFLRRRQRRAWNDRGWRTQRVGRDELVYEELVDGAWKSLPIDGEMLTGASDFAIYFDSAERWAEYPSWARERRDEIISRIRQDCPAPRYEYTGE